MRAPPQRKGNGSEPETPVSYKTCSEDRQEDSHSSWTGNRKSPEQPVKVVIRSSYQLSEWGESSPALT